ncbi:MULTISPECIES: GH32 C-terminal domain-containing protein [unclassified Cryobacterium]|uniref:glycoside hydrolase family 32 protein n=1 Tax=unclassified Cryobacterium TaxID=2649013 RepID=UPI00106B6AF0|nr:MULTISPECIES: GH32 C-terminal domain-containing protein [unclassified Cryobacterium]TFC00926.1 glycoside hydrolase family 32 protein [Cryobacterium sp. MDB2-A-1]TFC13106.1 glycoside hydrolase family 32 protein [Cryobacterium sp. MDB2-A-2]TFC23916.1 glycoside hydrolase family 32 protein [Cryobacterium sp. MDB2-10]
MIRALKRSSFAKKVGLLGLIVLLTISTIAVGRLAGAHATGSSTPSSLRAGYHLTPPSGWLSDPQRPVYVNGKYNFYYLHSSQDNGPGGWEHATSSDTAVWNDEGTALPQGTNFPVWTGSSVVDTNNTAGFGSGAVVALATQPTDGDAFQQSQYLWYSTDGGITFTQYGAPVIANPDSSDWFRDPKIVWDASNSKWVAVIGRQQKISFYTSPDLKTWTHTSDFAYTTPNIGGFECPDIFQIKASDGTWHWVMAGSMQGDYSGKPDTYAYWTGSWNGTTFTTDQTDPQWLDWGSDWYAAVTWPDQSNPDTSRYAIGWMNNWHYAPHAVPTDFTDNYNGQMSVVRQITLKSETGGVYSLLSQPTPALSNLATKVILPANSTVNGTTNLDYHGSSYELDADVNWTTLNNVGISVGTNKDGSRKTNIGVYNGNLYLDRSGSDQVPYSFGSFQQSQAPLPAGDTSVHLRILVDHGSVEVFLDDGKIALSSQAFFAASDTGVSLYTIGGSATFSNISITEFANITTAALPASPYADFEASNYGSWTTTGSAFGTGPASGALAGQQPVSGFVGNKLVNSFVGSDTSTGTLTSPSFTIGSSYVNFLAGGGNHPRPSDIFADFEGTSWGPSWTSSGSFTGQGPTAETIPNQVGAKVLDTYAGGGDSSTGAITSPEFTITRDYIDFMIAGGNHPWGSSGSAAVNLLVNGTVYRTATGANSSTMSSVNWDVHSLIGQKAQIQVIDHATGSWGHVIVDQIVLTNAPNATAGETDNQTTINLIVGGHVVRTATGQNSEHLSWNSWNVSDLAGQTAQIQIIDNNSGSWGHILVDQIRFENGPAA